MTTPPFPWLPYLVALVLIFLGAMAPFGLTIYALSVADGHGCTIGNGPPAPCLVDGIDRGTELHAMGNAFWYALYTWPAGIVLACAWFGVLYWHRRRWSRKAGFDA